MGGVAAVWALGHLPRRLVPTEGLRDVTLEGLRWRLDLSDNLQRVLYFTGHYEPRLLREVSRRVHPGDTVVDVGANIGTFALPLARAGAHVIAVEPASDTANRLMEHASMNELTVRIERVALGATDGTGNLRAIKAAANDTGIRSLYGDGPTVEQVSVQRGDTWLENIGVERVDVLKIDVEGAELDVLTGLSDLLAGPDAPRLVVVEANVGHQERNAGSVAEIVAHFPRYKVAWIRARGLRSYKSDVRRSGNLLFERSDCRSQVA